MIIDELPLKANGKLKTSATVRCQCTCGLIFKRLVPTALRNTLCRSCTTTQHNKNRAPETKTKMISAAADVWRGKTREEVMGVERRELERQKQSARNSGKNNPNYGGIYSKGFADAPLYGTWENTFGLAKASEMKLHASERNFGAKNPMYGKPSPLKSGNGISGWWKDILYFRSLLELGFILMCEYSDLKIQSAENKKYRYAYMFNGADRTYTPDFVDEYGVQYEIKPSTLVKSPINVAKFAVAPEVIILTEHEVLRPTPPELQKLIFEGHVKIDQSKIWRIK